MSCLLVVRAGDDRRRLAEMASLDFAGEHRLEKLPIAVEMVTHRPLVTLAWAATAARDVAS